MWLVDIGRYQKRYPDRIGPGRLVLVVGPSGAGKDTLIDGARLACVGDASVVFPRRSITRPSSVSEDNSVITGQVFNQAVADGEFALWWDAHGHRYGIPATIDNDIRASRTVVCNVSRTIIGYAQRRYALVVVVLVTAPEHVLHERLASRGRASDGNLGSRVARSVAMINPDVTIRNVGRPEIGIRRLLNAIRDPGVFIIC